MPIETWNGCSTGGHRSSIIKKNPTFDRFGCDYLMPSEVQHRQRVHTLVGPAHCTFKAPTCSEIPSTFAWGRKVPSIRSVPRGGCARVLSMEKLCTSRGDLRTRLSLQGAIWRLKLTTRVGSSHYILHTTLRAKHDWCSL